MASTTTPKVAVAKPAVKVPECTDNDRKVAARAAVLYAKPEGSKYEPFKRGANSTLTGGRAVSVALESGFITLSRLSKMTAIAKDNEWTVQELNFLRAVALVVATDKGTPTAALTVKRVDATLKALDKAATA